MRKYIIGYQLLGCGLICVIFYSSAYGSEAWFLNREQQAAQAFAAGDYAKAAQLFSNSYQRGVALYHQKYFDKAVQAFTQATQESSSINAWYNLGNSYAQLQQYEKAIESYQKVLQQQPTHADALHNLKIVQQRLAQQQQNPSSSSQQSEQKANSFDASKPQSNAQKAEDTQKSSVQNDKNADKSSHAKTQQAANADKNAAQSQQSQSASNQEKGTSGENSRGETQSSQINPQAATNEQQQGQIGQDSQSAANSQSSSDAQRSAASGDSEKSDAEKGANQSAANSDKGAAHPLTEQDTAQDQRRYTVDEAKPANSQIAEGTDKAEKAATVTAQQGEKTEEEQQGKQLETAKVTTDSTQQATSAPDTKAVQTIALPQRSEQDVAADAVLNRLSNNTQLLLKRQFELDAYYAKQPASEQSW